MTKETDFYPEIAEKFKRHLQAYLPESFSIEYSYDKYLAQMVGEIEKKLGVTQRQSRYIPSLKLDIVFGIKMKNDLVKYVLLEVKYLSSLGLSPYSQLTGYLQVAKDIQIGILLLVVKANSSSPLSSEFNEIIITDNLAMKWTMLLNHNNQSQDYNYITGISTYVPSNGIDWVDVSRVGGISSFKELADQLVK